MRRIQAPLLRYALALGSFALILAFSFGLPRLTSLKIDLTALIILVMIASAWYLGRGPGLIVALLFELTLDYFSTTPLTTRSAFIIFNRLVLFVSVVLFASSRRASEDRLVDQKDRFAVTLNSIGDAVIATDVNGNVTFINPTGQTLTGWSMADAVNQPLDKIFHIVNEETRAPLDSLFTTVKTRGTVVGLANHSTLIAKDGKEVPIEHTAAPICDQDGQVTGVIVILHNVSARRQSELERERLLTSEKNTREQAEEVARLKDEFLAIVSHELRTPLNAILGWSAMLNEGNLKPEEVDDALRAIERNARAQADIIGDILDVSTIITGQLKLNSHTIALAQIVERAIETSRPAAAAKSLTITSTIEAGSYLIAGDPARIRQVIWNLLSNAIKFTPAGGKIETALKRVNNNIELTVTDTGIGMNAEFMPHAFERFRQADSSTTRSHPGLGLGLAIVRHLVELHGGSVSATSPGEGLGSSFKVCLPAYTESRTAVPIDQIQTKVDSEVLETSARKRDLTGLRVLVVDDDPDSLEVIKVMLNQFGASVRGAGSASAALETFAEWKPDVLISDLEMPDEDGLALIGRLQNLARANGGEIPAAALTGYVRDEDRAKALAAGYQIHLGKPVDPNTLATVVARLASSKRK